MVLLLVRAETFVRNFDTMALSRDRDGGALFEIDLRGCPVSLFSLVVSGWSARCNYKYLKLVYLRHLHLFD